PPAAALAPLPPLPPCAVALPASDSLWIGFAVVSSKLKVELALPAAPPLPPPKASPPAPPNASCCRLRVPPWLDPLTALVRVLAAPLPPFAPLVPVPPVPPVWFAHANADCMPIAAAAVFMATPALPPTAPAPLA